MARQAAEKIVEDAQDTIADLAAQAVRSGEEVAGRAQRAGSQVADTVTEEYRRNPALVLGVVVAAIIGVVGIVAWTVRKS